MAEERVEILRRAAVGSWTGLAGLALAFREKYGDEAWEVFRSFMGKVGQTQGKALKEKAGIEGKGPEDVKRLLDVMMKESNPYMSMETRVEGNKIIAVTDSSKCPMVEVAKAVGLPLRTLCENMAFPHLEAVLRTVNPNIKHTSKELSETRCVDEIEIV